MEEIKGYKIYTDNPYEAIVISEDGRKYIINYKQLRERIKYKNYKSRYECMLALVNLLPKELPYEVREFLIF